MANDPAANDRPVAKKPEPRSDENEPRRTEKRTETFEVDAVTQEQEGGATTSEPEP